MTDGNLTAATSADLPAAVPALPAIPASAGALIFDRAGRLLILKPTYKTGWTIPGGVMEADGETPWDACRREVREECGLEVRGGRLACVDFRPSHPERAGGIRFLFDCGAADEAELAGITVQPEEVAEYRLVPLDEALELLRPPIRRRVRAATRHRRCVYLENGRPVDGVSLGFAAALGRIAGSTLWRGRTVGHVTDHQPGLVRQVQAGGVRLAYRSWGPAGAPPVVLLHALGEQSSDWTAVASALAPSWRVYAPDLRGHGASDWPGAYTIEQLTTDLAALLDALFLEQVTLAGHSIGAPPAYLYAARHPDRVARLVLEDPAPPWPRPRRTVARPEGPLPFDWDVTALSNEFTDPQVSSWRESLRRVQAPALLVAGGPASHVDQGQLARMATLIPDCELVTIPAGHLVHAAAPAEFTAVVTSFLRRR